MQSLFFGHAFLSIAILCISTSTYAAGYTPDCPSYIQVEQKISGRTEGWKNYDSAAKHPFINVIFSDDEPEQRFTLMPSKELKNKGDQVAVWNFIPSEKGIWISCLYNETKATLAKKLPNGISSCRVIYDKNFSSSVVKNIDCE